MENKFLSQFPKYPKGSSMNPISFLLSAKRNLFVNELLSDNLYGIKRNKSKIESFLIDENTLITRVFYANESHLKELIFKHSINDITDRVFNLKNAGVIFNDYEVLNDNLNHFLPYLKTVKHNNKEYYFYQKLNDNIHTYIKDSPYKSSTFINRIESNSEINTIKIYTLKNKIKNIENKNEVVEKKIYKVSLGEINLKSSDLYIDSVITSKQGKSYKYRISVAENNITQSKETQKSIVLKLSDNENSNFLFSLNNLGTYYQFTKEDAYMSIFKSNISSYKTIETGVKDISDDKGTLFTYELNNKNEIIKGDAYNSVMYSKTTDLATFDNDIINNEGVELLSLLTDLDKSIIKKHTDYYSILLQESKQLSSVIKHNKNIDSVNYTLQLEDICNTILSPIVENTENIKDNLKKNNLLSNKYKK